jgi:multidrug efflux pump subunit AcrA (membrane-fusion protein)
MSNENTQSIDAAINAAKAGMSKPPQPTSKRRRLTDEERAQRKTDYEQAKAERAAARAAKKAEKAAELARQRAENPPHLAKVRKAAEQLPGMSEDASSMFESVTGGLSVDDIFTLGQHLAHFVRVERTKEALNANLNEGDKVLILSGHPKFVGQEATLTKVQRIRCYAQVEGSEKPIYLFTSDVRLLEAAIQSVPSDSVEDAAEEATAQAV